MKEYTRTYMVGMGYDPAIAFDDQWIPCEVCDQRAVDVHHIDSRGMGGTHRDYQVEDLVGLCRICHEELGSIKHITPFMRVIHRLRMKLSLINKVLAA